MIAGFVIWTAVALLLLGIGIRSWRSGRTVGSYAGVKPPEVSDMRKYNRSVAVLWIVYAVLFELMGLPFLFVKHNSPAFLWSSAGVPVITIAMMIVYNRILRRFERKQ